MFLKIKYCIILMQYIFNCRKLTHLSKRDLVEMKGRLIMNLGLVQEFQGEVDEALKKLEKVSYRYLKL